jgi:hypothetical protein
MGEGRWGECGGWRRARRREQHSHAPADPLPPSPPYLSVIKEFGKSIGVDNKQVQGLIRLAKKNGEKLGFLA